jgi:hypothetical protein
MQAPLIQTVLLTMAILAGPRSTGVVAIYIPLFEMLRKCRQELCVKNRIRGRKLPRNMDTLEVELSGTMTREGGSNEAVEVFGAADRWGAQAG